MSVRSLLTILNELQVSRRCLTNTNMQINKSDRNISRSRTEENDCNLAILPRQQKQHFYSPLTAVYLSVKLYGWIKARTSKHPNSKCMLLSGEKKVWVIFRWYLWIFMFPSLHKNIDLGVALLNKPISAARCCLKPRQRSCSKMKPELSEQRKENILPDLQLDFLPFNLDGLHFKVDTC